MVSSPIGRVLKFSIGVRAEQTFEHCAAVILAAEKHREDAHTLRFVIGLEIEDRPILRNGSKAGQQVRPQSADMRRFPERFHRILNSFDAGRGMVERLGLALAESDVTVRQKIKNRLQVAIDADGAFDFIAHRPLS